MTESGKKFSFAFSKVSKTSGPFRPVKTKGKEDVQYIDCLDSKAIVCKMYVVQVGLGAMGHLTTVGTYYITVAVEISTELSGEFDAAFWNVAPYSMLILNGFKLHE
jgi:hypothetical protein